MLLLVASRAIVGLPSVSLVPCISNESREDRKQVDYIGFVVLEGNGFISWIRHVMGERTATRGGKRHGKETEQHLTLYLGSESCTNGTAPAREWRGLEDHCGDLRPPTSQSVKPTTTAANAKRHGPAEQTFTTRFIMDGP